MIFFLLMKSVNWSVWSVQMSRPKTILHHDMQGKKDSSHTCCFTAISTKLNFSRIKFAIQFELYNFIRPKRGKRQKNCTETAPKFKITFTDCFQFVLTWIKLNDRISAAWVFIRPNPHLVKIQHGVLTDCVVELPNLICFTIIKAFLSSVTSLIRYHLNSV